MHRVHRSRLAFELCRASGALVTRAVPRPHWTRCCLALVVVQLVAGHDVVAVPCIWCTGHACGARHASRMTVPCLKALVMVSATMQLCRALGALVTSFCGWSQRQTSPLACAAGLPRVSPLREPRLIQEGDRDRICSRVPHATRYCVAFNQEGGAPYAGHRLNPVRLIQCDLHTYRSCAGGSPRASIQDTLPLRGC